MSFKSILLAALSGTVAARSLHVRTTTNDAPLTNSGDATETAGPSAEMSLATSVDPFRNQTGGIDGSIVARGCAQQTACPRYKERNFDLLKMGQVYWWLRFDDCGQCVSVQTGPGGCGDFTTCGRRQNVCVDVENNRAHRLYLDNGAKECWWGMFWDLGRECNHEHVWYPSKRVDCTW